MIASNDFFISSSTLFLPFSLACFLPPGLLVLATELGTGIFIILWVRPTMMQCEWFTLLEHPLLALLWGSLVQFHTMVSYIHKRENKLVNYKKQGNYA
jgi:hypothetical protein